MEAVNELPGTAVFLVLLVVLGFAPIAAVIATSFLKIVVVLHLLKSALGLQEAPPKTAINAIALILSFYIMAPVGMDIVDHFKQRNIDFNNLNDPNVFTAITASADSLRGFLAKHADKRETQFFLKSATKLWPEEDVQKLQPDSLIILIPAFTITELKSAFEIGFLIYLPFVVIDLVVSNVLLALGMMMVSPIVISVPFKLLLFVLLDGWTRLLHGLVLSYQ